MHLYTCDSLGGVPHEHGFEVVDSLPQLGRVETNLHIMVVQVEEHRVGQTINELVVGINVVAVHTALPPLGVLLAHLAPQQLKLVLLRLPPRLLSLVLYVLRLQGLQSERQEDDTQGPYIDGVGVDEVLPCSQLAAIRDAHLLGAVLDGACSFEAIILGLEDVILKYIHNH